MKGNSGVSKGGKGGKARARGGDECGRRGYKWAWRCEVRKLGHATHLGMRKICHVKDQGLGN